MNYDSLVAPESLSILSPRNFVKKILQILRVLTGRLNALTDIDLASIPTRNGYGIWDIALTDILTVQVSGITYYSVKCSNPGIDVVGVGINDSIGLIGKDFKYDRDSGTYLFNDHPTKYGTVSIVGTKEVLTIACFGSPLQSTLEPLGIAYRHCTESAARDAIYDALYADSPLGVTPNLNNAVGGCRLSAEPLTTAWEEGEYTMGITTRGELIYAPTALGLQFISGSPVSVANSFTVNNIPNSKVYCVRLSSGTKLISSGENAVSDYPGITTEYPTLTVTADNDDDDGKFYGNELITLMLQRGCVFYRWNYIKNSDAQRALSCYAVNPGKVVIEVIAQNDTADDLSGVPITPYSWGSVPSLDNFSSTATAVSFI